MKNFFYIAELIKKESTLYMLRNLCNYHKYVS